jgi:YHS domain-containing protein
MKKFLSLSALFVLLLGAFLAGTWFNQHEGNRPAVAEGNRQILHYVDPMNPSHITKEPGIAPCGMPMEPVYADSQDSGGVGSTSSASAGSPGIVRVDLQKQQIMGVEVGKVEKKAEIHAIRALGRVAVDENRTYTVFAATDGWMGEIHQSTTGSLVRKDQLMAQIRVYDYDFFTWQQRYLTEMGNTGRRPVYTIFPGQAVMDGSAGKTEVSLPPAVPAQAAKDHSAAVPWGIPPGATEYGGSEKQTPPDATVAGQKQGSAKPVKQPGNMTGMTAQAKAPGPAPANHAGMSHTTVPPPVVPPKTDHSMHKMDDGGMKPMREDDILYASKARLELVDLGVGETQLAELVKTGIYVTRLDLRSPVDGLVISRNVSPRQWIARGTECFRIADLHKVWIEVDIYDFEAQYIRPGISAEVVLPGSQEKYVARVSEVPPRFDAATRTLKVRLEVDNPGNLLRPEMFVDVDFRVPLPEALVVPAAAVVDTGLRKTVYIATGEGVFEPREVRTGWHFGDQVEIVEGLQEGDSIVVAGKFLIDSESRMKLAAARLMTDPQKQEVAEKKDTTEVQPVQQRPTPPLQKEKAAAILIDPVCGMEIPSRQEAEAAGFTTKFQGKAYYFCSADCKEQFERNPQGYIDKVKEPLPQESAEHMGHSHD